MAIAVGEFEVNIEPLGALVEGISGNRLDRMSISKTFSGDLEAKSQGEMLSARTSVEGSAGYVALEQVEGTLHGRRGSFILQHFGMLDRGEQQLILSVVPGSGTGELEDLSGSMAIRIEGGRHFYELDYSLAVPSRNA